VVTITPQVWDAKPELLTNKQVADSAWALFGSTVAVSFIAGFVSLEPRKK